jgi:hypothetical protein
MAILGMVFTFAISNVELPAHAWAVLPGGSSRSVIISGDSLRRGINVSTCPEWMAWFMAYDHTAIVFAIQSGLQPRYNESSRKSLIVPLPSITPSDLLSNVRPHGLNPQSCFFLWAEPTPCMNLGF